MTSANNFFITCSNVSKHNYCFSDFPFPDDVPDYPHNKDMAKYIKDYATHFDLEKHIEFFTKVKRLEKTGKNKFKVKFVNLVNQKYQCQCECII